MVGYPFGGSPRFAPSFGGSAAIRAATKLSSPPDTSTPIPMAPKDWYVMRRSTAPMSARDKISIIWAPKIAASTSFGWDDILTVLPANGLKAFAAASISPAFSRRGWICASSARLAASSDSASLCKKLTYSRLASRNLVSALDWNPWTANSPVTPIVTSTPPAISTKSFRFSGRSVRSFFTSGEYSTIKPTTTTNVAMSSHQDNESTDASAVDIAFSNADAAMARYQNLREWCFLAIAATLIIMRILLPLAAMVVAGCRHK